MMQPIPTIPDYDELARQDYERRRAKWEQSKRDDGYFQISIEEHTGNCPNYGGLMQDTGPAEHPFADAGHFDEGVPIHCSNFGLSAYRKTTAWAREQ